MSKTTWDGRLDGLRVTFKVGDEITISPPRGYRLISEQQFSMSLEREIDWRDDLIEALCAELFHQADLDASEDMENLRAHIRKHHELSNAIKANQQKLRGIEYLSKKIKKDPAKAFEAAGVEWSFPVKRKKK